MRRPLLVVVACVLAGAALIAQAPSSVERDLITLENQWTAAWQKRDAAFLAKLLADEYLSTDSGGNTATRAQELAGLEDPGTRITSFALTDLQVHVYGDTAVVTGLNTVKATVKGKDVSGGHRFTDVFVKRDGRWQVVATQSSVARK